MQSGETPDWLRGRSMSWVDWAVGLFSPQMADERQSAVLGQVSSAALALVIWLNYAAGRPHHATLTRPDAGTACPARSAWATSCGAAVRVAAGADEADQAAGDPAGSAAVHPVPAGMTLTPAGHALAGRTPAVLVGWDQTLRETKGAASREARVLRVGFMSSAANEATQQIIAALLRLPFPGQDDVRIEVLLTEQISFDQLWDEPFVAAPAETGLWRDYHLATAERQGHPVRIVYVTDQPDAYLTAIANGAGIALVPESAARYYARPGITYRPVTGVSPSQVGVAWPPASDTDPVVQDFVRCCLDHKPTPHLENQPERIP